MKQQLITRINELISEAQELLQQKTNFKVRRELSEVYLSLDFLNDNFTLEPISKASIEFLMNKIIHRISYEGYFNYYMCFYYLPQSVYDKDFEKLSNGIFQSNINISCFRCLIHASKLFKFSLDTSANRYFFSNGSRVVKAIKNFISYPFDFECSSMVYLLLNYYQTLCEYEQCSDTTYQTLVPGLKNECECLFAEMYGNETFSETIQNNPQLLGFWCSTVPEDVKFEIDVPETPEVVNVRHLWIMCSYFEINVAHANTIFKDLYGIISIDRFLSTTEIALIVRLLCFSLNYENYTDLTEYEIMNIHFGKPNRVKYPLSYFFKNYNNINQQSCTPQDLRSLISLDDSELRKKVAECMQNVDANELERQVAKPHGALEISDLDVKFTEDGELKYLCMPFKTGREITSETMSENYMYQLIKPFSHFGDNCIVVLITAKKCSQGLETYIERMSIRQPSWRIEVIQNEQLCKLLKANSLL